MDIPTQTELLGKIDDFCARHDIAETRFGRDAVNNPAFVRGLRDGKSPTLDTLNKVAEYMARTDAEAVTRAKLAAPIDGPPPEPEEIELPFRQAPVSPTGDISATSSSTSAPRSPPEANGCSRSTAEDQGGTAPSRSSSEAEPRRPRWWEPASRHPDKEAAK